MVQHKETLPKPPKGIDPLAPWDNAFFITINTNTNLPGLKNALNICWKYFTSHGSEFFYGRPNSRFIEMKQHYAIEIGKKYHKIHLHGRIVARTTGIAFLDYFKVNDFFNKNLRQIPGFTRCNFQAKLIKNYNQSRIIQEYIDKDVKDEDEDEEEIFTVIT